MTTNIWDGQPLNVKTFPPERISASFVMVNKNNNLSL